MRRFASGEIYFRAEESVRGADVFVVQTHYEPVNEAIMEQLIMIDAMKRASAKRITAVIPYYGYSRQDKKALAREPISAKLVADLLTTAGADRVVSVDLHSGQIQGYFDSPFDHLTALPILSHYLKDELGLRGDDLVVVAPDAGRIKTAEKLREYLHADLAFLYKRRSRHEAHKIEEMAVVGEVDGRPCVLVDDMIDTAGTVAKGAQALADEGAGPIYVRGDARHLQRQGASTVRGGADPAGRGHQHGADPRESTFDKLKVLSDRAAHRERAARRVRGLERQRDLRGPQPGLRPDRGPAGQPRLVSVQSTPSHDTRILIAMETKLKAEKRDDTGKGVARKLRAAAGSPACCTGTARTPVPLSVDSRDMFHLLHGAAGGNALVDLVVDGEDHLAMAREIQRDHIHNTLHPRRLPGA